MSFVSLHSAITIYNCAAHLKIRRWHIQHQDFEDFCFALRKFERKLGDVAKDIYWTTFLRAMRNYRFELTVAPIPFNYMDSRGTETEERLRNHLRYCESIYPSFVSDSSQLLDLFCKLIRSGDNPGLVSIASIPELMVGNGSAIVIIRPGLLKLTEEQTILNPALAGIETIGVSQLRGERCYHNLVVVGPLCWFPEYIIRAPRTEQIHAVTYGWLSDRIALEPVFLGTIQDSKKGVETTGSQPYCEIYNEPKPGHEKATIDPDELIDTVDWESVKDRASSHDTSLAVTEEDAEFVEAMLFLLEGDKIVPLDSSEAAKVNVIDFDRGDRARVLRIPVLDIELDTFILLRTEGGGEYIVEVADKILGNQADHTRNMQKHWKSLLRKSVNMMQMYTTVCELKKRGAIRANEVNIRNWMSYRSIRTDDPRDFKAIMDLIGLREKTDEYWTMMTVIDSAHRRAGQLIRKLLVNQVLHSNIQDAEKLGRIDFELPETGAGSLTAFQVRDIYKGTVSVPYYRIGHVFDIGEI